MTEQPSLTGDQPGQEIDTGLAQAERALASLTTAEEASNLADFAAAAAAMARRVKLGLPVVNYAVVVRVLAEIRMAGLVDEGMEAHQIARPGSGGRNRPPSDGGLKTLGDMGINDRRLAEARRLARDYTEAAVRELGEAATDEDRFLSRDKLLRSDAQRMQASGSNEWWTPPKYLQAARTVLGAIDLDPASCAGANANVQASRYYTTEEDGLAQPWKGRVWLNPPYGGKAGEFVSRLVEEHRNDNVTAAITLVSSHAVDTDWFYPLWDALLCVSYGRIAFISPEGDADAPSHGSVFAYLGRDWEKFAETFGEFGAVVTRWGGMP